MKEKWLAAGVVAVVIAASLASVGQPDINSVTDSPDPVEVPGYNNITADITNAVSVHVEISYPNATLMGNYSMTNAGGNIWYHNHTYAYPDPLGTYSYVIKAQNATGWNTSGSQTFALQDTTEPSSSVDTLPQYWYNGNATITATASDNYQVDWITLFYRYSSDNSSWGSWTSYATDNDAPWQWEFNFTEGEGYYLFLTRAQDTAGNSQPWPPAYQERAAYDITLPSSTVDSLSYWHNSTPISVNATATDGLSGIEEVTLYYRHSSDNSSWGSWSSFATDSSQPWQFSFTAPAGDGHYEVYTIATDNATNQEVSPGSADEGMGLDTTAPTTSKHITGPVYGLYVTSSSIFNFTANDALCGVNATYYRVWHNGWSPTPGTGMGRNGNFYLYASNFTLTGEGLHYLEFYSDDIVDNQESVHNHTQRVDDTPPSLSSITATPSTQTQGGSVNISCQSTDSGVGIDTLYVEVIYPDCSIANFTMHYKHCTTFWRTEYYTQVGTYDYTIYAVDKLGNGVTSGVYHFTITSGGDTTPPVTTATLDPASPDGPAGWYISPVEVTLSATDDDSGVNYTQYRIDNGSWITYSGPFTVSSNGQHQVDFYSVDNAGNVESTQHVNFKINISSPVTSYTLDPATPDGDNGWYLNDVNITLSATDPDGIDYTKYRINGGTWLTYTAPFVVSGDGVHVVEFYSVDMLGNTETVKSIIINIDGTDPTISLVRPRFSYLYLFDREILPLASGVTLAIGRLTATASAVDLTSGVENVTFYTKVGSVSTPQSIDLQSPYQWIWSGDIGTRELYAVACDEAGNTAASSSLMVTIFSL